MTHTTINYDADGQETGRIVDDRDLAWWEDDDEPSMPVYDEAPAAVVTPVDAVVVRDAQRRAALAERATELNALVYVRRHLTTGVRASKWEKESLFAAAWDAADLALAAKELAA